MYLRKSFRVKDGKRHQYWALVESYRTERGPRQRTVAWLGEMDEAGRVGVERAAENRQEVQGELWEETVSPEWVEVDVRRVRVEKVVDFGGPWLGLELLRQLKLDEFLAEPLAAGKEEIPWAVMAEVLVLCRLCHPSSELYIAEHYYEQTALADLLGVPADKINDDRLYRALDQLLPQKAGLEQHLKELLGSLFELNYDLLLYDLTSTYFEGQAEKNEEAQYGYSRDQRRNAKQVCIGLVVTREGFPLGYEVFAGNRADGQTVEEIVRTMEKRYGQASRIWVMDRGMASKTNFDFLRKEGRRYIVGTVRSQLKGYEQELLKPDWEKVQTGLEVKKVPSPDGEEVFILCRSQARAEKEKAMHTRFEQRIEEALKKMVAGFEKRHPSAGALERRVGRLLTQNSRAAGLFEIRVSTGADGRAKLVWSKRQNWQDWARLSEGCYMLRSNVRDFTPSELWKAYVQLTEAEEAFRIQKGDLGLRPIWHQKPERVRAHILVCFLAYVLWKTLAGLCARAGLGDEPRQVLEEIARVKLADVILPTRNGPEIRLRCVATPTKTQATLLEKLKLKLPSRFPVQEM
jgi:transposase